MNALELAALLGSFVSGVLFALLAAWPQRREKAASPRNVPPPISWPGMLDTQARLAIVMELASRLDSSRLAILRAAHEQEADAHIRAVIERALGPVIGEPR